MELGYVYTLFSIICLDMAKNQRHPALAVRCSLQSNPVDLLVCLNSPYPQRRQNKRDLGPLIAPVGLEDCPFGAPRLPAILSHTEKLGKQFEKDIG
jgi:hypothetical protein